MIEFIITSGIETDMAIARYNGWRIIELTPMATNIVMPADGYYAVWYPLNLPVHGKRFGHLDNVVHRDQLPDYIPHYTTDLPTAKRLHIVIDGRRIYPTIAVSRVPKRYYARYADFKTADWYGEAESASLIMAICGAFLHCYDYKPPENDTKR